MLNQEPQHPDRLRDRMFDPAAPQPPEEILGLDTQAILELGHTVAKLGFLPADARLGMYALPNAVVIFPLVEQIQSGTEVTPQDVRPYRKPIKQLIRKVSKPDGIKNRLRRAGLRLPLPVVNEKIEEAVPEQASEIIESAIPTLESLSDQVDLVSTFDNPRKQFEAEVSTLAAQTKASIFAERDERVRTGRQPELPPPPRGILGLAVRVVRKVREFFGFFRKKPQVTREVTAYDAAAGIEKAIGDLYQNRQTTEERMPLLSKLVLDRIPTFKLPEVNQLAFMAPEILSSLFSMSEDDQENAELMESIKRNPHEFRFVTNFKRHYRGISLDAIQQSALDLLPAIRNVLPEDGKQLRSAYESLMNLVTAKTKLIEPKPQEQKTSSNRGIKRLFKKRAQIMRPNGPSYYAHVGEIL